MVSVIVLDSLSEDKVQKIMPEPEKEERKLLQTRKKLLNNIEYGKEDWSIKKRVVKVEPSARHIFIHHLIILLLR